jgi:protein-L-isoaspartate(D-aspartate) O-methyltransferase
LAQEIAAACAPFEAIETAALEGLLSRIGDARVVLLGEATHGTSEFYRMRARISRELIQKKDFFALWRSRAIGPTRHASIIIFAI